MSLINILAIIFVFGLLVLIHELGHFLAARWMGVRVERFSIGFPPVLYSRKIGDTEFCLSAIPLGGYVKMAGFVDESMDTKETGADDEYSSKPVWKRMVIITAGVIMNFILAVVIYTFLSFSQGEVVNSTTTITVSGESGVAEKIGLQSGDEILAINGEKVDEWNDIPVTFFEHIEDDVRFDIVRDGQQMQLTYKGEWLSEEKGELLDIRPLMPARVGDVSPDMPAAEVGLQDGDRIVSITGKPVNTWDEMSEIIRAHPGEEISIAWQRNGQQMESTIKPITYNNVDESGTESSYGIIGIRPFIERKDISFARAAEVGITQPFVIMYLNIKGMWWWISGKKTATETIGGPVMIAKMAGDAARAGWIQFWSLIAALSTVLAFFNILPIPALDGGHLAFLIAEGIMGRPLSIRTRLIIQQVGMALLLTFIIFVLYIDINRFF